MLKIELILKDGRTRLHLSGELRSADIGEVRTEIKKIVPRVVLDLAEIGVVDIEGSLTRRQPGGRRRHRRSEQVD